ncbi:MAG: hypothetical protein U9R52_01275 [Candidatus Omnitrophota bacterium]|nr:hypothetical protein [Candidatus Omnitrophota bacterium]
MPNHIHGIIIVNNPVGTGHALSSQNIHEYIMNNPKTWHADEDNIINYSVKGKACLAPTGQLS